MISKEIFLRFILTAAKKAHVKVSIGGGIAVNAYGYRRETADVDAFFHYTDQAKILKAINKLLDDYILEELDPSHWIVVAPDSQPDERLDLLFASGDPEESAIEMAIIKTYRGIKAPMFPVNFLIVSKFMAERDDAKDALDIYALHRRGAFNIKDITILLKRMGFVEDSIRFPKFMTYLDEMSKQKQGR